MGKEGRRRELHGSKATAAMAHGGGVPECRRELSSGLCTRRGRGEIELGSRMDWASLSSGEGNGATTQDGTDVETAMARAEDGGGAWRAREGARGSGFERNRGCARWIWPGAR